ncbi:MAG: SDR family NAD(P)-dependent oxidoreductase [Acidimicrobiia bacterium]|jgi:NAD(P)-dependent dehydrogenase (short-subunit alcohol dehydrogenase family)
MAKTLITGCSTGFGRAAAVELTKRGHEVIATARRPETLDDLDVAGRLRLDVDDDASVAAAVAAAGPVDALVNNAGFGMVGPVEKVPLAEARRVLETNVLGTVRMIQAVLPQMRERGSGTIVNVTSLAGRVAPPLGGVYAATKWAVEGLSEALHYEVGHFGVRVRVIEPGVFDTGFQANEPEHGIAEPPYDELRRQWDASRDRLIGGPEPPGPEIVAAAIADAVEAEEPRLRWPVGDDADMVLGARTTMDDATFEATMRGVLDLTW